MRINSINSSRMGYYNYQSTVNNIRLTQALSRNPKIQSYFKPSSYENHSLSSSMSFVKKYTSSMSELMSAANELRDVNRTNVLNDMKVSSSNESVATAVEKYGVKTPQELELDVTQIARAQSNVSEGVKGSDAAQSDMNFTVQTGGNSVDVQVSAWNSDGTSKTNAQMLKEAADKINQGEANVTANVVTKDGNVSLELIGKSTGRAQSFSVNGNLGAAQGLDKVSTESADAKYSMTVDGKTTHHESSTNEVTVNSSKIGVTLKDVGKTTIKADVDADKVASAVGNLVDKYNSSLKLLNDNYGRGSGVDKQLRNLVLGLGSEKSLEQLGITVNKDATLKFDKNVLAKNMKENPSLTKDLISGSNGIAQKAFHKAASGMNVNSSSLINGDLEEMELQYMNSPLNTYSMYSRSGAYAMNNYAALGMMINYLI